MYNAVLIIQPFVAIGDCISEYNCCIKDLFVDSNVMFVFIGIQKIQLLNVVLLIVIVNVFGVNVGCNVGIRTNFAECCGNVVDRHREMLVLLFSTIVLRALLLITKCKTTSETIIIPHIYEHNAGLMLNFDQML